MTAIVTAIVTIHSQPLITMVLPAPSLGHPRRPTAGHPRRRPREGTQRPHDAADDLPWDQGEGPVVPKVTPIRVKYQRWWMVVDSDGWIINRGYCKFLMVLHGHNSNGHYWFVSTNGFYNGERLMIANSGYQWWWFLVFAWLILIACGVHNRLLMLDNS